MITLTKIIINNANFVDNSGFKLTKDSMLPSVLLENKEGESVFFQEDQARDILDKANKLYEESGDVTTSQCIKHVMLGWIENF